MRRTGVAAAVLVALWAAGIASGTFLGGWIHVLLIVALAAVIARALYVVVTMD